MFQTYGFTIPKSLTTHQSDHNWFYFVNPINKHNSVTVRGPSETNLETNLEINQSPSEQLILVVTTCRSLVSGYKNIEKKHDVIDLSCSTVNPSRASNCKRAIVCSSYLGMVKRRVD